MSPVNITRVNSIPSHLDDLCGCRCQFAVEDNS